MKPQQTWFSLSGGSWVTADTTVVQTWTQPNIIRALETEELGDEGCICSWEKQTVSFSWKSTYSFQKNNIHDFAPPGNKASLMLHSDSETFWNFRIALGSYQLCLEAADICLCALSLCIGIALSWIYYLIFNLTVVWNIALKMITFQYFFLVNCLLRLASCLS